MTKDETPVGVFCTFHLFNLLEGNGKFWFPRGNNLSRGAAHPNPHPLAMGLYECIRLVSE